MHDALGTFLNSEIIGNAYQNFVAIKGLATATQVSVAIFEPGRYMVGEAPFDTTTHAPAIEIVTIPDGARVTGCPDLGSAVFITAANVQKGSVGYQISGSSGKVESIGRIDGGRAATHGIVSTDCKSALDARTTLGATL